ncbi:response regulator [Pseudomonas sp. Hp2]|uniref:response regulator n=1 Tax=Pseudomonas sp. Hp2 TaxID=701189 RepID=UPI001C49BF2F|nr:response regulator [Pseudomonas sp. Hp2]
MKILYVEDDDLVRLVTSIALEEEGHTVVQALNGRDAQSKLAAEDFDWVITDVTMPDGVSGIDVAHAAKDRNPAARVVLVSGISPHHLPPIPATVTYFSKPFRVTELIQHLSGPLAAGRAPSA